MIDKKPLIFWVTLSLAVHVAVLAWCPVPSFFNPPYPVYLVVDLFSGPTSLGKSHGLTTEAGGGNKPAPSATETLQPLPAFSSAPAECEAQALQAPPTPAPVFAEKTRQQDSVPAEPETTNRPQQKSPTADVTLRPITGPVLGITTTPITGHRDNANETPATGSRNGIDAGTNTGGGTGSVQGQGGQPASGSPVDTPLAYGDNPPPPYPSTARRRGWEGEVLLLVNVTATGRVSKVTISQSSGYQILDRAAANSVYRWRFQAAMRNGRAVPGLVMVPIRFSIKDTI